MSARLDQVASRVDQNSANIEKILTDSKDFSQLTELTGEPNDNDIFAIRINATGLTLHIKWGTLKTWVGSSGGSFSDSAFEVFDNADATKKISFQVSGVSTGVTRVITFPDENIDLGALTKLGIVTTGTWQASEIQGQYLQSASSVNKGAIQIATIAETNAGLNADKAVVPATLANWNGSANIETVGTISSGTWQGSVIGESYLPSSSTTQKGLIEVATQSEVDAGSDATRAVTPSTLASRLNGYLTGYTGATSINTVGTITTGTWQGSPISTSYVQNLSGTNTGDEPDASTTTKGVIEIATQTEVNAGADSSRAVTPLTLATRLGAWNGSTNISSVGTIGVGVWQGDQIGGNYVEPSTSVGRGVIQIASVAEVQGGTDSTKAITPAGLKFWQGSTNITTVGTITSGTWQGDDIPGTSLPSATELQKGIIEIATAGEVSLGTDDERAVTPKKLKDWSGSSNITTVGIITTGTWRGTLIDGDYITDASTTAQGVIECAIAEEIDSATSSTLAITPGQLKGSVFGQREVSITAVGRTSDVTGSNVYASDEICIGATLDGFNLKDVTVTCDTLGGSGSTATVQIERFRNGTLINMLSSAVTVSDSEYTASDGTINTTYDDVQKGDKLRVKYSGTGLTAKKGLVVNLEFKKP